METYVPGFKYDIFLSYSRANNAEQWVSKFRRKLDDRLKERVPPGAKFFRDTESLQGNDELTPEIVNGVRGSAILVVIVSRSYISRPWCQKECREFIEANKDRLKGRIFPVRYDDVSPGEYQKFIGERTGYEFFAKLPDDIYADTLDPESDAFKGKMNVLRMELGAKLEELKAEGAAGLPPHTPSDPAQTAPQVFLAASAPGLVEYHDGMVSYLKGFGYDVLQPGERFYELEHYESTFAADLRRSLLFVQLLGKKFSPHPDDSVQSWDRWQSLQAEAAGVPILRWFNKYDGDGHEIDVQRLDGDHRDFVKRPGVWDCDPHRFRELVRMELETRFHDLRQKQRMAGDGAHPLVVLRAEQSDRAFADTIGQTLKQYDCDWLRIPDKAVPSLESFAKDYAANGLLIVYRACSGQWVLTRLQEMRKFLQSEFGRRWACGLWREPIEDEDALAFSVDGVYVIEPCNPQHMQEFVTQLRTRSGVSTLA